MSKATLLVIDDHANVRAEVRDRIESLGYDLDEAAHRDEALAKIEEVQYDCVLLDLEIPMKLESPSRIVHGKNLLQQIVAKPSPPPVIVITSHGKEGYNLAVEMMEMGAKTFVGKPFAEGELEKKIQKVLAARDAKGAETPVSRKPFTGGALVMSDNGIVLCGVLVGGVRGNANIREVVKLLAIKNSEGKFVKASGKHLAEKIPGSSPASLTAAIKEFRCQCTSKLLSIGIECGDHDVIDTAPQGYRFCDGIEVRLGKDSELASEVEKDCAQVMSAFGSKGKITSKKLRESVNIPAVRITAALERLQKDGKIEIVVVGTRHQSVRRKLPRFILTFGDC